MSPNNHNGHKGSILAAISSREQSFPIEVMVFSGTELSPPLWVQCEYQDGKDMEAIVKESMIRGRNGQLEGDNDRFRRAYCRKHIRGWSGFTLEYAFLLTPKRCESMDIAQWYEKCPDGELPYSEDEAELVYHEAPADLFFTRIRDGIEEAVKVRAAAKAKEIYEAQKNFVTSRASKLASAAGTESPSGAPASTAK